MATDVGPFDDSHMYVQNSGKLPGGETFSWGFRLANTAGGTYTYSTAMHTAITNAVKTYHSSAALYLSGYALLNSVKCNLIAPNGKYAEATTHEQVFADLAGGGGANPQRPNQVAAAVTLTTGFSRGPAHKGRFYLPLPQNGLDVDGRMSVASTTTMVTATNTLIASVNAADPNWKMAIFSRKAGNAAHRLVIGCQVGRVLDTQRRRRRGQTEMYV